MAKPRGFDLEAVALLEAIDSAGSLAKAAARLGRVPSALTWQVRRLEESLDLLLVDRRGGRARLTEAARQLLRDGLTARQALDDALTRAPSCTRLRGGTGDRGRRHRAGRRALAGGA